MDNGQFFEIYLYSANDSGTFFMYLYPFAKSIEDAIQRVHLYSDSCGLNVNCVISNGVIRRMDIHDEVTFNQFIRGYVLESKFYYDENQYKEESDKSKLSGNIFFHL